MTEPLRLGIAGLGTVGAGVVKIIRQKAALLEARSGRPISISAVSARNRVKDRGVPLDSYAWEDDPVALAKRDDVDVFVELMGGSDGPAKAATEAALRAGKDVVTANKALLAHHGQALAEAAEKAGAVLRFEAAVAGGIPVVKALTEGLAGNDITRVMGVMNGTCNYILTRMEATGQGYEALFDEANKLGYLEADPNLDVGGIDAGHKLSLLSSLAFGTQVDFDGVELEGIQRIALQDIRHAADMGYRIKLLGVAQMTGRGLEQRMSPCLVPADSPLGQLEGGTNIAKGLISGTVNTLGKSALGGSLDYKNALTNTLSNIAAPYLGDLTKNAVGGTGGDILGGAVGGFSGNALKNILQGKSLDIGTALSTLQGATGGLGKLFSNTNEDKQSVNGPTSLARTLQGVKNGPAATSRRT